MDDIIFVQTAGSQADVSKQWQVIAFDPSCMQVIGAMPADMPMTAEEAEDANWIQKAHAGRASGKATSEELAGLMDRYNQK